VVVPVESPAPKLRIIRQQDKTHAGNNHNSMSSLYFLVALCVAVVGALVILLKYAHLKSLNAVVAVIILLAWTTAFSVPILLFVEVSSVSFGLF
jgi:hypothetical protein